MSNKILNTYAAYAFDDLIRKQSSSGAIFSLIAEKILSLSGIVYGVTMTDDCKGAEFVRVDNIEQLHLLRGSKYIQAKVGQAYKSVKNDLNSGRIVLFSGTGCQNNGLKKYLGKDYENLYCIDVVCHGVPSPKLWRHYLEHIETINNAKIIGVNFRCKDQGWKNFGMEEIQHDKKKVYIPSSQDSFMRMFLRNYCLRPSCYECEAKLVRCADLTLADFWGINFVAPEMNDNKGVSLVIIRSQRGQSLFDTIQEKLCYKKVDYNAAIKYNPSEITSAPRPKERNKFFSDLEKKEFIRWSLVKPYLNKAIGQRKIEKAQALIDRSGIICLYGMSIGITDNMWWEYIGEWLKKYDTHLLIIYNHDSEYQDNHPVNRLIHMEKTKNSFLEKTKLGDNAKKNVISRIIVYDNQDIFSLN